MKSFLLTCCLLFNAVVIFAQLNISGKIIDENQAAIPFANVAVFSTPDSSMVTGAVSDENGTFSTKVNSGQYYLRITFLSY
ncbi:MAG TPA: carboxypeptidase regulatory-like domain-containing protein, partial [Chryseosolibacter sp.]|nr:carboxypeptidase regulatory-like domain-containing protein [Chryseosolibacter sp.]